MIPIIPLYNELLEKSENEEKPKDWRYLCSVINGLDREYADIIYVLILHHYLQETAAKNHDMTQIIKQIKVSCELKKPSIQPYKIKSFSFGKGVTVIVEDLPVPLQKILSFYVKSLI